MTLVGFALVFVVCAWTLSAIGGLGLAMFGARIARIGPLFERRVAVVVAIVPLLLAVAVTVALLVQSSLGEDHCMVHGHHAHLCLVHGTGWLELPSAVVTLSLVGATMLARGVLVGLAVVRGFGNIRALHAISQPLDGVRLVTSERAFCFVAGWTPSIYVSTRVWNTLSADQRAALVAHERAHVTQGDLRTRGWLELCLLVAAPLVGDRARATWLAASERVCDARAAQASSPEAVASAMVSLFRLQTTRPTLSFGLTPSQAELASRVEAVLGDRPLGERVTRLTARIVVATCAALVVGVAFAAEPLHHAFETLLG